MNRLKPALTQLLVLSSLALSGLVSATAYPLTVTDDLGRKVTLPSEPKRIVTMLPSHTETLFAIGAGEKLVGIDEYSNYPKVETDKIAKVGSGFEPNLEAIVALKPDLVLADESTSSKLVEKLEKAGVNVYGGTAQTYNEVFEKIAVIGKITNREAQAVKLIAGMRTELNTIQASVRTLPKVTAYFEIDPTPYSVGPNSFIGVLLKKAGGLNIIPAKLGDFPKISPELVVSANPAAILGVSLEDVLKRPGWANIAAVKTKRVVEFSSEENDAISRPGPRLPVALRAIVRALHPEFK
jgi:iron complex transport system substrate-binding protein